MKVSINQVKINRVGINTAYVRGIRLGSASKGGQTSPFHPSLVDYWNFKGKSNFDKNRNTIKGIKGNILNAYNFGWALGSGYGLYKENYNNVRQLSGTTGVFNNTDHSIYITNVKTVNIPVTEIPYKAGEVSPEYQIKVTGLLEGQQCSIGYYYNYTGDAKPPVQENLIDIQKDGIYTVPSVTFLSDIKSGTATRIVFNFAGDTDITIEQIPLYEGAIVTDGVDDYLKLDKVGYKIGTVIIKHKPIRLFNGWQYVLETSTIRTYMVYNFTDENINTNFDKYNTVGDYGVGIINTPRLIETPLYIGCQSKIKEFLSMALYEIAIYSEILTDEEIQKEIKVMEYGTPNPVFALNFDNFAYKAVDYPDFATGKATTNKIVVDSTTESFTGVIAVAMNPEVTTGDAIEVPAYKLKISGFNDYNLPESSFGVAILASNISGGSEYIAETPALDGVYDVPSIALSDGIFNLAIVTQIAIDKPIEIEILYDKNITKSFPETKQIFP